MKKIIDHESRKSNKKWLENRLEEDVFFDPMFQAHLEETAKLSGVELCVAERVVKTYLKNLIYNLHLVPKTYTRIVPPFGLFFKLHFNKVKRFKKEKNE